MRWAIELAINTIEASAEAGRMPAESATEVIYDLNDLDEAIYDQVKDS